MLGKKLNMPGGGAHIQRLLAELTKEPMKRSRSARGKIASQEVYPVAR